MDKKAALIDKREYKIRGYEVVHNPTDNFVLLKRGAIGYYLQHLNKACMLTKFDFENKVNLDLTKSDLRKFGVKLS